MVHGVKSLFDIDPFLSPATVGVPRRVRAGAVALHHLVVDLRVVAGKNR